ncbi:MAG: translation initiation factor IF-2 [Oscillospiraceae bacterium]|jgi:translation initiation factor IF-2|nr:translation initiation factor IF-2 [Oscillospiraceae bacterium]
MRTKYKVSELAKDFGLRSKVVIELLEEVFGGKKKGTSSALEVDELDVVFERLVSEQSKPDFSEYFATRPAKPAHPPAEEPKPEPTEVTEPTKPPLAAEQKAAAPQSPVKVSTPAPVQPAEKNTQVPNKPAAHTKPAPPAKPAVPARPTAPVKKPAPPPKPRPTGPLLDAKGNRVTMPARKEKSSSTTPQARTQGEARIIDTRSTDVVLDKYNERYAALASSHDMRRSDTGLGKQKLKKRNTGTRPQGMKGRRPKETEGQRMARLDRERARAPKLHIKIGEIITIGDLAELMKRKAAEVIKKLFTELAIMATVNEELDYDTAELVADAMGVVAEREIVVTIEEKIIDDSSDTDEDLIHRAPVVVVMGHVDHGKTSILDVIRNTSVTDTESGGITQHIGAYRVELDGQYITFLDTPGHAAFTSMRARGAMATDIAVLVVAADDGIMPQTVEAINHAKAADVRIIVAINKMDRPGANPEKVKQQLTEYGLVPEEWGGETICVPVSAVTKEGIDKLLEAILLEAEVLELKANPNRAAKGIVIEARMDKERGPIATLLVQNGTLRSGDYVVAGATSGRVRVMTDDKGQRIEEAGPAVPVEIMGLDKAPTAGDSMDSVSDERLARELVEQRRGQAKALEQGSQTKVSLENLFESLQAGQMKTLGLIVKADVQGSVEALKQNLEKLTNEEVQVKILHAGVGAINDNDVMLANTSNAIVIGFRVRPDATAQANAERQGVQLRMYSVIYQCIEEVEAALKGMLAPKYREVQLGRIEVRQIVHISSVGNVAGCHVLSGKVTRAAKIRVVRDGVVVAEDELASLKRFKDDVKEVASGYECGIVLTRFGDIKEGDIFEAFIIEEYRD